MDNVPFVVVAAPSADQRGHLMGWEAVWPHDARTSASPAATIADIARLAWLAETHQRPQ